MCRRMMLVVAAVLLVAVAAQATVGPITKGIYNSSGITLDTGSPSWSADLTDYTGFIDDVYQIGGYFGGATVGSVIYEDDATQISNVGLNGPFVQLGLGGKGWTLYKFVLPAGQTTDAGGTITADALRSNNGSDPVTTTWLGVTSSLSGASTVDIGSAANEAAFTKDHLPAGTGWGTYGTLGVDIPVGVSEFYVALMYNWGNQRLYYETLDVNAVVVPEPATMVLLGLGGLAALRRRK